MKDRLNIYVVHSSKIDYNNLLYRDIISSPVCLSHNVILPLTKNHQTTYVKDLIKSADIIVVEISNPTVGLKYELSLLKKEDKPILYLSFDNSIPKGVKRLVPDITLHSLDNPYIKLIEDFILKEAEKKKEDTFYKPVTLGEV